MSVNIVIVLCCFNPDRLLFKNQIDSIAGQTISDFVCLVMDDGSEENSVNFVRDTISGDHRFLLMNQNENLGVTRNFEEGIKQALKLQPRYIALSDQDDQWEPQKIENQLDFLVSTGSQMVSCDLEIVNSDLSSIRSNLRRVARSSRFFQLLAANDVAGASIFMTSSFAELALPFPEANQRIFHDHWLALLGSAFEVMSLDERVLYKFVQHGSNDSGDRRSDDWDHFRNLWRFAFSRISMERFKAERLAYILGLKQRLDSEVGLDLGSNLGIFRLILSPRISGDRKLGLIYLLQCKNFFNSILKRTL
jgi:glycosyltransferase involved in cell wall biosynthesis